MDAKIYIKTVKFNKKPVDHFEDLLGALEKKSGKGYCEKHVDNMNKVSNRKLCGR